jgi:hypothetical protein
MSRALSYLIAAVAAVFVTGLIVGILTITSLNGVRDAITWSPPPPPAKKVDISQYVPEEVGDVTRFSFEINDEYSRYASDINHLVESYKARHPELCFSARWDDFQRAGFRVAPVIHAVQLYHTLIPPPAARTPTRTQRPARLSTGE